MSFDKIVLLLKYATLLNLAFIALLGLALLFSDTLFTIQKPWFQGDSKDFSLFLYGFVGFYKLLWIFFNLFPYLILRKMRS